MSMIWEEQAKIIFEEKVEEIDNLRCMVKLKLDKKRRYIDEFGEYTAELFNIRGTRIFLLVKKNTWVVGNFSASALPLLPETKPSAVLCWKLKRKKVKRYISIEFSDVLDSELVSPSAKEELVFNLGVFLSR